MTEIGKPIERGGIWAIIIKRDDGEEEVRFPDRKAALAGEAALRRAADLLLPRVVLADPGTMRGPYFDRSQDRWLLRWEKNGEAKAFSCEKRAEAITRKSELCGGTIAGPNKSHLKALSKSFKGGAPEIKRALVDAMFALNAAARDGNDAELARLRKYAAGLSEISHAVVPHTAYARMKEEFDALIAYVQDIQRGRTDAGQSPIDRRINSTLADQPKPPTTVH